MTKEDLTLIVAVVDGSGSMNSIKKGVIDGFNEFISDQKQLPGDVLFTMIQFDSTFDWNTTFDYIQNTFSVNKSRTRYNEIYSFKDLKAVKYLTDTDYTPQGGTPLIEAMTTTIDSIGTRLNSWKESERPSKVIFVTITDGQENSSDRNLYNKAALANKIKHQQDKYNWKFIYLGANQDSFAEAGGLNYLSKAISNYEATNTGTRSALHLASASVSSYRSGTSDDIDLTKLSK